MVVLLACVSIDDPATTEIYTLSLHDALPIYQLYRLSRNCSKYRQQLYQYHEKYQPHQKQHQNQHAPDRKSGSAGNAETDLVCRLLLEKKKTTTISKQTTAKHREYEMTRRRTA